MRVSKGLRTHRLTVITLFCNLGLTSAFVRCEVRDDTNLYMLSDVGRQAVMRCFLLDSPALVMKIVTAEIQDQDSFELRTSLEADGWTCTIGEHKKDVTEIR